MENRPGGASIVGLSYIGGDRVVPHYGGGMSTAKAALQIDAKQLAHNLGTKNIRVNIISAGPYASRAASAIGDIDQMIDYAAQRSPLPRGISRKKSPTPRFSCAARWRRRSRGMCYTSIAAITPWECEARMSRLRRCTRNAASGYSLNTATHPPLQSPPAPRARSPAEAQVRIHGIAHPHRRHAIRLGQLHEIGIVQLRIPITAFMLDAAANA